MPEREKLPELSKLRTTYDADEILSFAEGRFSKIFIRTCALGLIVALGYAHFFQFTVSVKCRGVLVNKFEPAVIKSPGNVSLARLFVVPGQHVVQGQVLAVLNMAEDAAKLQGVQGILAAAQGFFEADNHVALIEYLQREDITRKNVFRDPEMMRLYNDFLDRFSELESQQRYFDEVLPAELAPTRADVQAREDKLKSVAGDPGQQALIIKELKQLRDELTGLQLTIRGRVQAEEVKLSNCRKGLKNAVSRLQTEIQKRQGEYEIRSPVDGTLAEVFQKTEGSLVRENELFVIRPSHDELLGRLLVDNRRIKGVEPGREVFFSIEAFPQQKHGRFLGEVRQILDEPQSLTSGQHQYLVVAGIKNKINPQDGREYGLRSGMEFEAEIRVRSVSLLTYLVDRVRGAEE